MKTLFLLFLFISIYLGLYFYSNKTIENYYPYYGRFPSGYSTRNTRNMPYDLRCIPYTPKRHFAWNNSTFRYHYRPKCLVMG